MESIFANFCFLSRISVLLYHSVSVVGLNEKDSRRSHVKLKKNYRLHRKCSSKVHCSYIPKICSEVFKCLCKDQCSTTSMGAGNAFVDLSVVISRN